MMESGLSYVILTWIANYSRESRFWISADFSGFTRIACKGRDMELIIVMILLILGLMVFRRRIKRRRAWMVRQRNRTDFGAIPESVKNQVWRRAAGQCEICGSSAFLQYDHIVPRKWGGSNTLSNIQLLCNPCHKDKTRDQAIA